MNIKVNLVKGTDQHFCIAWSNLPSSRVKEDLEEKVTFWFRQNMENGKKGNSLHYLSDIKHSGKKHTGG